MENIKSPFKEEVEIIDVDEKDIVKVDEDASEDKNDILIDEENPLSKESMNRIKQMIDMSRDAVKITQNIWQQTMKEYNVNEEHMKELHQWNEQHKEERPTDYPEDQEWDILNGLDSITEEEAIRIFGEDHDIIGVDHQQTKDRIKAVATDFSNMIISVTKYNQLDDAYYTLLEIEEEKNIELLKAVAENEEDENKKKELLTSVENYYRLKELSFLKEPLDEKKKLLFIDTFNNEQRLNYWFKRTRDKLKQIRISDKFILQISRFEERFMEDEYHKYSNILLVYFMNKIIHTEVSRNSSDKTEITAFVLTMDALIRNRLSEDRKKVVIENIKGLLDQFSDVIYILFEKSKELKNTDKTVTDIIQ